MMIEIALAALVIIATYRATRAFLSWRDVQRDLDHEEAWLDGYAAGLGREDPPEPPERG